MRMFTITASSSTTISVLALRPWTKTTVTVTAVTKTTRAKNVANVARIACPVKIYMPKISALRRAIAEVEHVASDLRRCAVNNDWLDHDFINSYDSASFVA